MPDEALCALLWEYKSRGQKGYDLTERMFELLRSKFPDLDITGPERAGRDIRLGEVFENYPKPDRPADFMIKEGDDVLAIGFARYDGDRGGAQEDDRTGGNRNAANELLGYAKGKDLRTKIIFVNDGPGLLLGSMWDDYAYIEDSSDDEYIISRILTNGNTAYAYALVGLSKTTTAAAAVFFCQNYSNAVGGSQGKNSYFTPEFAIRVNGNVIFSQSATGNQDAVVLNYPGTIIDDHTLYLNGSTVSVSTSTSGTQPMAIVGNDCGIGAWNSGRYLDGEIQELILYTTDQASNITDLYTVMNSYWRA